jgi:hypothetical protein
MDEPVLRGRPRPDLGPDIERLIHDSDEIIERVNSLVKAVEAAIHTSHRLAIEAAVLRSVNARRRAANATAPVETRHVTP